MNTVIECPICKYKFEVSEEVHFLNGQEYIELICKKCKENLVVYQRFNPALIALKYDSCICSKCKKITINPKTEENSNLFPKLNKGTYSILCKSCWMIMLYEEFFLQK